MTALTKPRRVSGGDGEHGHLDELATDPISLFWRVRDECGDVGLFQLADREVVQRFRGGWRADDCHCCWRTDKGPL